MAEPPTPEAVEETPEDSRPIDSADEAEPVKEIQADSETARQPRKSQSASRGRQSQKGRQIKFDPKAYKRGTVTKLNTYNDLSLGRGPMYMPCHSVAKKGPGVTAEMELIYGPCALMMDFKYTTWAETVVPLKNVNTLQGFNEMCSYLMKLASNNGGKTTNEDAFLAISFLSNVRNDIGEIPPNTLSLLEFVDNLTKPDTLYV